jgi:hypothetical protein
LLINISSTMNGQPLNVFLMLPTLRTLIFIVVS